MRFNEINTRPKNAYAGTSIVRRYVRRTATPLPTDSSTLEFLNKHVKKETESGSEAIYNVLIQYDDDWYRRTFRNDPAIVDFISFYNTRIRPYYRMIHDPA